MSVSSFRHSNLDTLISQLRTFNYTIAENIYWVYGLVIEDEVPLLAVDVMARLREKKVGSRPFFWPMVSPT